MEHTKRYNPNKRTGLSVLSLHLSDTYLPTTNLLTVGVRKRTLPNVFVDVYESVVVGHTEQSPVVRGGQRLLVSFLQFLYWTLYKCDSMSVDILTRLDF